VLTAPIDRASDKGWAAAPSRRREHRVLFLKLEPPLRRLAEGPKFGWLDRTLDWLKRRPSADQRP
jgi:hypothetical protein